MSCYQSHSKADAICSSQIPHLYPSSAYSVPFDPNIAFPIRSYAPGKHKKIRYTEWQLTEDKYSVSQDVDFGFVLRKMRAQDAHHHIGENEY